MVGDHQRTACGGQVTDTGRLDAEPISVQRPQQRQQDVIGKIRVEAEFVDGVVPAQAPACECQQIGQVAVPLGLGRILLRRFDRWHRLRVRPATLRAVQRDYSCLRHPGHAGYRSRAASPSTQRCAEAAHSGSMVGRSARPCT